MLKKTVESFTDDDIEKYRIVIKTNDPTHGDWWFALPNRLEAAELYIWYLEGKDVMNPEQRIKAKESWLRAAGKDGR